MSQYYPQQMPQQQPQFNSYQMQPQIPPWMMERMDGLNQKLAQNQQYQQYNLGQQLPSPTMPRPPETAQSLECWPVKSRDEIKGVQARNDMQPTFYYNGDTGEVYSLRMGMDGLDMHETYVLKGKEDTAPKETPISYVTVEEFNAYKSEMENLIGGLTNEYDGSGKADNVGKRNKPAVKASNADGEASGK